MKQIIEKLEEKLADYVGIEHCICTGSGTGSIIIILKALNLPKNSEIITSPFICPSVPLAISMAGMKPIFADININDYNLDPESIRNKISKNTKAILAVHLFGQTYPVEEINKISKEYSLVVIEDAAQSFGGTCSGKKHGALGDVSLTSFGEGKIIKAGGGAAIFTNDDNIAHSVKSYMEKLQNFNPCRFKKYEGICSKSYMFAPPLYKRRINTYKIVPYIYKLFKNEFLFKLNDTYAEKIYSLIDNTDVIAEQRYKKAQLYKTLIKSKYIKHPLYDHESGIYFYYSCLLNRTEYGSRYKFIKELANRGIEVRSSYQLPVYRLFANEKFNNVEYVSSSIFNLLVEPEYDEERIAFISENIVEVAENEDYFQ